MLARPHAGLPGYRWAQYASGLAGAAAIALWLARWWRTTPAVYRPGASRAFAATSWTVIALAAAAGALLAALPALRDADVGNAGFLAVTRGGGAGLAAALLCALAHRGSRRLAPWWSTRRAKLRLRTGTPPAERPRGRPAWYATRGRRPGSHGRHPDPSAAIPAATERRPDPKRRPCPRRTSPPA
ncbi:DUF4184 family protein [Phytohabitans sp. ZYX-F-186]|uniref:DUF4184 family protein n=1 Tax=Phytohabitans maris TaxID=3071409 RepID=A0ABU0ZMS5_9ACTN|nr:DUF4184 family protein [Phytohabitans sp. ZYX-F-186]MDQ7908341.1 DUF4184 family protein [Phytohabitans sp. ZYX-F-186]